MLVFETTFTSFLSEILICFKKIAPQANFLNKLASFYQKSFILLFIWTKSALILNDLVIKIAPQAKISKERARFVKNVKILKLKSVMPRYNFGIPKSLYTDLFWAYRLFRKFYTGFSIFLASVCGIFGGWPKVGEKNFEKLMNSYVWKWFKFLDRTILTIRIYSKFIIFVSIWELSSTGLLFLL